MRNLLMSLLSGLLFVSNLFCQGMNNQTVITEEYVPKVIIEGKWGTNAGEFGRDMKNPIEDVEKVPDSLAVDSKGNIYILDAVNNRIQKFNNEGKYILSLPVDSWRGEVREGMSRPVNGVYKPCIDPTEAEGINIAMDDDDNLYYYGRKKSKEAIRKYVNDKPVKKWEVKLDHEKLRKDKKIEVKDEKGRAVGDIVSDYQGGTRFEPIKNYEVEKKKLGKDTERVTIKFMDGGRMEKEVKAHRELKDTDLLSQTSLKILNKKNEVIFSKPRIFNKKTLKWEGEHFSYVYDLNGNLKSVLKGEPPFHNDGNDYDITINQSGLIIKRIEKQQINK
ncbi:MAG: hypothetical protein PHF84_04930 [bacterium]|nr:hypothetical protein [bacterium]